MSEFNQITSVYANPVKLSLLSKDVALVCCYRDIAEGERVANDGRHIKRIVGSRPCRGVWPGEPPTLFKVELG